MLNTAARRWILALASLAAVQLACARADAQFAPITPQAATPLAVAVSSGYPGPAAAEPQSAATATQAASEAYPGPAATQLPAATQPPATAADVQPTATEVLQQPPTETPTEAPTTAPTDTPPPAPDTSTPAPTDTSEPTATTGAPAPQPIPGDAQLIQTFTASAESGIVVGRPQDMADQRTETWASLRGGNGIWKLDLGQAVNVAGVKLYAQKDGADPTTLIKIEVSTDGQTWTTVFQGSGNCGVANCDTLVQRDTTDIGWTPTQAQFIRLYGGPFKFALGEIQVAVIP